MSRICSEIPRRKIWRTAARASLWAFALGLSVAASAADPAWRLVWSDEFDREGAPDPTRWVFDVGGDGWGNKELQFYTANRPENARVKGGRLIIEARCEPWQQNRFTSARLITKGRADWLYGRFEIRAKLPTGRGTWPAIWMLPTVWNLGDGLWPDNGEMDIMEHVGHDPGTVHASMHSRFHQWRKGTQRTGTLKVADAAEQFHTYALEWSAEEVRVLIDDTVILTARDDGRGWESWPFNRPYYLILNLAVGGDWGSVKGIDDSAFPQRMEVDFVRVYQRAPAAQ